MTLGANVTVAGFDIAPAFDGRYWGLQIGSDVVGIEHGNGLNTGYAHIMPGGIGVHIGQQVGPGQLIARTGTTGHSTGCHLHFIVRHGESLTDPVPFMRNQGITLG